MRDMVRLVYQAVMLIAFNKPFGVLSQFTAETPTQRTLAEFRFPPEVYSLGRLDADSEGLLLLSDETRLNAELLQPHLAHRRLYWAQVERVPGPKEMERLSNGVQIRGQKTRRCRAWVLEPQPILPERNPPIRNRKTVPTCWIGLELTEGKNRQVRHMTAAIGFPTLRLIRVQIGEFRLGELGVGQWVELTAAQRGLVFA